MTKRVVTVAVVLAVLVGACGGPGEDGTGRDGAVPDPSELAERVCDTNELAQAGDKGAAVDGFHDLHGDLHALADSLSDTDRQAAGDLLRAKQQVEGELSRAPADRLADDLRQLAVAVAAAGDRDPPTCA